MTVLLDNFLKLCSVILSHLSSAYSATGVQPDHFLFQPTGRDNLSLQSATKYSVLLDHGK